MGSCWHHSVLCAVAARSLATECARGRPESSFVAGLLHDVGQPALFDRLPNERRRALLMTVDAPNEPDLHLCEREILGFNHATVGGALPRRWRLPPGLVECIEFHHDPAEAQAQPLDVAIAHIANTTAVLAQFKGDEFEDAPGIEPMVFEVTGLKRTQVLRSRRTRGAVEEAKALLQKPGLHWGAGPRAGVYGLPVGLRS